MKQTTMSDVPATAAAGWRRAAVALALLGATTGLHAQAESSACGPLANGFGPFDYRTDRDKLPIVENHHFTPQVESLLSGVSGPIAADLDYLLRAFPNHHRGLNAMARLTERLRWARPPGARWDVDCYFERALRFRPNDLVARLLYAQFLIRRNQRDEAMAQIARVAADPAATGITQHNAGLLYLELKEFDRAQQQALRAQEMGFTRADLTDALRAAGRWPPAHPAEAASAASGPAASAQPR